MPRKVLPQTSSGRALKLKSKDLKTFLEKAHADLIKDFEMHNDAIEPALYFKNSRDKECVAFICSVLAYGRVDQIKKSIRRVVDPMGKSPVQFLIQATETQIREMVAGWKHRFNTENDIALILFWLKSVYTHHESLERFVDPQTHWTAYDLIENIVIKLCDLPLGEFRELPKKGASFWFLLPRPSTGGACKRMNLFLRWMVGKSEVDFGLWGSFDRSKLIIPLDTHILNQSRRLKLTRRKTSDWKTAEEITNSLRKLDPQDPTRFDFAICHLGMKGQRLAL